MQRPHVLPRTIDDKLLKKPVQEEKILYKEERKQIR